MTYFLEKLKYTLLKETEKNVSFRKDKFKAEPKIELNSNICTFFLLNDFTLCYQKHILLHSLYS